MDNIKAKLIELLITLPGNLFVGTTVAECIADHLIANGVTLIATDTNVGDKWISVTERLPKPYVDVVVCRQDLLHGTKSIGLEYVTVTYDEILVWSKDYMTWKSKVSHWMPLPEPPKGE